MPPAGINVQVLLTLAMCLCNCTYKIISWLCHLLCYDWRNSAVKFCLIFSCVWRSLNLLQLFFIKLPGVWCFPWMLTASAMLFHFTLASGSFWSSYNSQTCCSQSCSWATLLGHQSASPVQCFCCSLLLLSGVRTLCVLLPHVVLEKAAIGK